MEMEENIMDGTEKQKDTLQAEPGQSSTVENQGTSEEKKAKTYTEQEKEKIVNDALAAAGRTAKQLSEMEARLKSQEEAIKAQMEAVAEFNRRKEEAELEEARSDPSKMREYQRRQAEKKQLADLETQKQELQKQRDEIARSKAEHEAEVKAARDTLMEVKLWQIGAKYGISPMALKELNLPTVEQVEAVAKRLGAVKPNTESTKSFAPDSGVTSGKLGALAPEQFEKLPISEKAKYLTKK